MKVKDILQEKIQEGCLYFVSYTKFPSVACYAADTTQTDVYRWDITLIAKPAKLYLNKC